MIWHRYSEKRPKSEAIVWVLTKRMRKPELRRHEAPYKLDRYSLGRWEFGGRCQQNDLWCEAEVPPMPAVSER